MNAIVAALAILSFYAFFYRIVLRRLGSPVSALVAHLHLETRHPAREVEAVGKLAAAGVAQLIFAVTLMALLGVGLSEMLAFSPAVLALGALLGIGELALAGLLCTAIVHVAVSMGAGGSTNDWFGYARGGWMRYFTATATAAPPWLAAAIISLYVAVEELVFRGIVISAASPHGATVACALSALLFTAVQAFGMPSVRASLFPIVGAAVVGPIHAVLFWQVQDVGPLVAAHLAYFSGALLLSRSRRPDAAAVVTVP